MTEHMVRIGSTIIERENGKFAFWIHVVPENMVKEDWTVESLTKCQLQDPVGDYETMDGAMTAGSAELTRRMAALKQNGISAARPEMA